MIPTVFRLDDIQAAFRDLDTRFGKFESGNLDMGTRRIVNTSPAVGKFDVVTKFDLEREILRLTTDFQTQIDKLKKQLDQL